MGKIKMSVFSRFAQKFYVPLAGKARQLSTTLKRKANLDHISTPWDSEMNIISTKWSFLKMLDFVFFWSTIWAIPCATMSHTTQSLLAQQFYNPLQKVMNQKNSNMKDIQLPVGGLKMSGVPNSRFMNLEWINGGILMSLLNKDNKD